MHVIVNTPEGAAVVVCISAGAHMLYNIFIYRDIKVGLKNA